MFAAQVQKSAPILFMPTDVIEKNDRVDNQLKYRIYMTGVMPCGSRTMIVLEGIEVHFDIMVPDGMTTRAFDDFLRGSLIGRNITYTSIRDVRGFKLKGFQKTPRIWKRVVFDTLQDRKKGLDWVESMNREYVEAGKPRLETAADDVKRGNSDYYFPKVAREMRFATADWNRIEKYTAVGPRSYSPNCDYVLRVNIRDLKKLDKKKRQDLKKPGAALATVIDRDPTMIAQWDIETWRRVQNGLVPTPKDEDYIIFMLCAAYFWHHTDVPMMSVCCFHTTSNVRAGMMVTVECVSERDANFAHMYVMGKMAPEILSAFNGQNFDWPLYREKLRREGLLVELKKNLSALNVLQNETETNVLKWCFTSTNIKIDAETKHHAECVAKFPGMIDIDVLPIFLKMYPRMEVRKSFSLNFFLQKNGLESKEDMHFKTMFKIYERARKLSERSAAFRKCHCAEFAESIRAGVPWKHHCACADVIPEIDCKKNPKFVPDGDEPEYLQEYHDDLVVLSDECADIIKSDTVGMVSTQVPKCCHCGKAPRNLDGMRDVAYYCTIDTIRPQQLCVKRAIIPDKRELSTMSYVSLYDSFFRADGMKVRNLIGSYAHRREIQFSNAGSGKTAEEKDHYPGAWVFPPERGLHAARPITGLDFASLYPSLMMTYNLSPDMVVYDRGVAEALEAEGYSIYHIEPFSFERGEKKGDAGNKHLTAEGWTVRHNGIFNPKKNVRAVAKYVKTITNTWKIPQGHELFAMTRDEIALKAGSTQITNDVQDQTARELSVETTSELSALAQYLQERGLKPTRRVKYVPVEGREALPGERMGIFAFIVKKLFDKRVPIKQEFVRLSKLQEQMELAKTKVWTVKDADGEYTITMAEVKFQIAKVDSKQKALKVLANTFYGESGNYLSSIYELLVAAGITCAGQKNIKKVSGFITSKGYGPRYGDSVTHDTPVLIKFPNGDITYRTIDNLSFGGRELQWQQYGPALPDGTIKECAQTDFQAWSDAGWTEIRRVIRHKTTKDIYRVITSTGLVDVTSDHSLLSPGGDRVTPLEVRVGTELMHADLPSGNFIRGKCHAAEVFYLAGVTSDDCTIRKIVNLGPTTEYVYDLETANHHFSAGIGRMIVHNTDSIYTTCPESVYAPADAKYGKALSLITAQYQDVRKVAEPETDAEREYKAARVKVKTEYWTEMVAITMKVMNALKEEVSDFLLADNGTCFLNMAYEEVGFPTVLCGKKKYYMTPHIETINFNPKDVFIRGIDIIKQGQTQISKKLGDEFIRESLSPANERELIEIAVDKIRKFYSMKLEPTMFALSAKYNPTKKNVPVLTFVSRMKEMQKKYSPGGATPNPTLYALYESPEPGDKFTYVIVKKDQHFTLQGKKIEIKKGDQMEFLRVYNHFAQSTVPMEIDMNYYIKNAIVGIFARFIAYHPRFQPPEGKYDVTDKEQYKQLDEFCVSAAGKYLEELCDSITGFDKTELKRRGLDYRAVYRRADKAVRDGLVTRYGPAAEIMHSVDVHDSADDMRARSTRLVEQIKNQCRVDALECCGDTSALYVAAMEAVGVGVFKLKRLYMASQAGMASSMNARYKVIESKIVDELFRVVGPTSRIIYDYERRFIEIVDEMRAEGVTEPRPDQVERVNGLDDEAANNLETIHSLQLQLTTVYMLRERLSRLIAHIERLRMQKINEPVAPVINPREMSLEEAKISQPVDEFQWG
jgi:DNA polymerase elongation subunit (family B)